MNDWPPPDANDPAIVLDEAVGAEGRPPATRQRARCLRGRFRASRGAARLSARRERLLGPDGEVACERQGRGRGFRQHERLRAVRAHQAIQDGERSRPIVLALSEVRLALPPASAGAQEIGGERGPRLDARHELDLACPRPAERMGSHFGGGLRKGRAAVRLDHPHPQVLHGLADRGRFGP